MNKKEIALEVLKFKRNDIILDSFPAYCMSYYGANHEGFDTEGHSHDYSVGTHWTDIWGVGWHKEHADVMGFPRIYPLDEPAKLKNYKFPNPNDERIISKISKDKEDYNKNYMDDLFLGGLIRDTMWEKSYMLIGMENIMEYFYTEESFVNDVMDSILEFQLSIIDQYIKAGATVFLCGDDLGTQNKLLLSPYIIDKFLKPRYKKITSKIKQHNGIINFHSCGHIEPLLEMFIDLGVDILNPLQATANNLENVIKITQNRLALQGGISSHMLTIGTPDEVRTTVLDTIKLLGKNGGYFCGPDQGMPFKEENIKAMQKEIEKYNEIHFKT